MNKTTQTLTILIGLFTAFGAHAQNSNYLELTSVLREHSYDLDIRRDANRFLIDEQFRGGFSIEGGWAFAPSWTLVGNYTKHDTDNADGIILTPLSRVQAPIFYIFQRASLGIKKNWSIGNDFWLDTTVSYQKTEQGVGNFFIQNGELTFGLDAVEKTSGVAAEIALRKPVGNWEYQVQGGFDPSAGFELSASGVEIESSTYVGAEVSYHFRDRFKIGLSVNSGKVSDLGFTIGLKF